VRIKREVVQDRITMIAAAVAFYAMLSVFPLIIAGVSLYGMVTSPEQLQAQMSQVAGVLPSAAREVLQSQLRAVIEQGGSSLSLKAGVAIAVALFSASTGTTKMIEAIGLAYDEPDERNFFRRRGLALLLTLGFVLAALVSFGLVAVTPVLLRAVGLGGGVGEAVVRYGRWLVLGGLAIGGLGALYRLAPHRTSPQWQWVSLGSFVGAGLWLLASLGFSVYVERFGSYGETYGALGGVVVLMMWLYLSALAILVGAELNSEVEAQTAMDSTVGPAMPLGERGAVKADTLGELRD